MAVVANTRKSSWRSRVKQSALVLLSAAAFVAGCWLDIAPAQAQMVFPKRQAPQTKPKPQPGDKTPSSRRSRFITTPTTRHLRVGNVQIIIPALLSKPTG
jgi:hypothetical protein